MKAKIVLSEEPKDENFTGFLWSVCEPCTVKSTPDGLEVTFTWSDQIYQRCLTEVSLKEGSLYSALELFNKVQHIYIYFLS